MRRTLCILSIAFLAMILCANAYAAIEPIITVNGMTGTVNVATGSPISVKLKLSPGDKSGTDADWWLVSHFSGKWYYYTLDGKWTDIGDSLDIAKLRPAYQGKLFDLSSTEIFSDSQLSAGNYTLYFGVDMNMNGKVDTDSLVFKTVNAVVGGSYYGTYSGSAPDTYTGGVYYPAPQSETSKKYYEFPSVTPEYRRQPVIQTDKLVDFIPLQNGYGVRVIESGEQHILRIVPLSDPENGQVLSELVLDDNPYSGAIANGNMLYLVFSRPKFFVSLDDLFKWISKTNTKIQVIDLSVPQSPVKLGSYSPSAQTMFSLSGQIFQTDGSVLLIPYSNGKPYQHTPGDLKGLIENGQQAYYDAEKRVRILDFSDPDHPKEISDILLPDIRGVSRYFMNGRILYVSHFKNTDTGSDYYLSKVDFSDLSAPSQSAPISIPAPCIGTDPSGMYAFTVGGGILSSLRLGSDRADLADKAEMHGSYNSDMIISDGFAYLNGSSGIVIADISNPEKLGFYKYQFENDANTNASMSIVSVKNRRIFAYVNINKVYGDDAIYMICYDASNPQSLRVDSFFERAGIGVYQYAFSDDNAYLSLGNYGLWIGSISN